VSTGRTARWFDEKHVSSKVTQQSTAKVAPAVAEVDDPEAL